ncbi:acid protease [Zopfia rhizophila CBS 207.26]|uniref:Acid protease n=1 Tax=Zopfia rhizophila CBS 207.26 TaxID=1314779 RepID=A0A6A6EGT5_9PEZI|nr:acid protease [Zopfia rhizophila CBS 207.26]
MMEDVALIAYGLNISIGTPPQSIKVLFDISWPTFFLQSAFCQSNPCTVSPHTGFNSSESSTYIPSTDYLYVVYDGVAFEGNVSLDTLNVAGLGILSQVFLNAVDAHEVGWLDWYFDYDGVLGFAPNHVGFPSPWENIVNAGLLDRNLFSISPPTGNRNFENPRVNGELVLGGLPQDFFEEQSMRLPLVFSPYWWAQWATTLQTLTFGNSSQEFSESAVAYFSTSVPSILLPGNWGKIILDVIGPTNHTSFFDSFPCEKREYLPDLTFGIGGRDVSLNAFQYAFELTSSDKELHECVVAFERNNEGNAVGLGWSFLENFQAVFDWDERAVLLAPIRNKTES